MGGGFACGDGAVASAFECAGGVGGECVCGEHYQQLRQTLGVGLDYEAPEALLALLSRDFVPLWQRQYHEVRYFPSAQAVLAHVRSTGVGHLRHQVRFAQLRGFVQRYEGLRSDLGYPLTYQALQFIGVRR